MCVCLVRHWILLVWCLFYWSLTVGSRSKDIDPIQEQKSKRVRTERQNHFHTILYKLMLNLLFILILKNVFSTSQHFLLLFFPFFIHGVLFFLFLFFSLLCMFKNVVIKTSLCVFCTFEIILFILWHCMLSDLPIEWKARTTEPKHFLKEERGAWSQFHIQLYSIYSSAVTDISWERLSFFFENVGRKRM